MLIKHGVNAAQTVKVALYLLRFLDLRKVFAVDVFGHLRVFGFFVPLGEGLIKPIAFGLALGVAIDAFLVRMTLGPAVMKLLHGRAWWLPTWLSRSMPVMDVEGEALAHQLRLQEWPTPDDRHAVYGEGLAARAPGGTLFEGLDLSIDAGRTVLVTGEPVARRALLLALTGRTKLTDGELRVLGLALPEQAGPLRRRSTWVDPADPKAADRLAGAGPLVVVDDADRLAPDAMDALRTLIAGLAARRFLASDDAGDPVERPTIVLGAADPLTVRTLPLDATIRLPEAALPPGGVS